MLDFLLGLGGLAAILYLVVPWVRSTRSYNKEMKRLDAIRELIDEANALPDGPEKRAILEDALRRQGLLK